jgi:UDP-glucose 4-epimerase
MNILVTGGAGYIGSVVVEQLLNGGARVVVYDNLTKGHRAAVLEEAVFIEGDLADREKLARALRDHKVEAVIHMAADSLVGESMQKPSQYYRQNVINGLTLLDAMIEGGVKKIVFSSTAAVYGEPTRTPIEETDPTQPTNPYGETKLAFEGALKWYEAAYGLRYVSLRYFNAAGASERLGEDHSPETHLIPIVMQVALGQRPHIEIFGDDYPTPDGTCIRDYIHVVDLADAHILGLNAMDQGSRIYNLGYGSGYSVKEVIEVARKATRHPIPTKIGPRRPGDPAILIASSERLTRELDWQPKLSALPTIIESAWHWHRRHSHGYAE